MGARWQRYWFAEGGRLASACVRIALALSVLVVLRRLSYLHILVAPDALYRPVGPWMLLGASPPAPWLVALLWVCAWTGTLAMLVGFQTRIAVAVSFVAAMSLAALSFSGRPSWSHQYNVVFLAQCAFLGARCGDTLSVDALLRRLRKLPPIDRARAYQWSLRLVQLAVALMFAGAFFYKLYNSHGTLRWALTDNLRHQLLVRYDLAGLDRTAAADWIIDDVWKFRAAAVLNMVTQLAPIFACIFVRRPRVRALFGALFLVEVVALDMVVSLANPAWIPIAAVFVDWDALAGWIARRAGRPRSAPPVAPADWSPPRAPRIFIAAFLVYDLVTSFVPNLDQKLNTYPFSSFPMFSALRVQRPYDEHRPFSVASDHYEVLGATADPNQQRWLDHISRGLFRETDPARVKGRLRGTLDLVPKEFPGYTFPGLRHYLTIFETPAYPAPARFEPHPIAITGELLPDGTFRTLLGTVKRTATGLTVELRPQNVDTTGVRLVYYADDRPTLHELPTTGRDGNRFELPKLVGRPVYLVAITGETAWLVATLK